MSADPIIYCLQELTDYFQFERLGSDVMAGLEYRDIEPLGGHSDRGRDALFISRADPDDVTIFAYSVRADWRTKLNEDCRSIREHGHQCKHVVFVSTADLTTNEKDSTKNEVKDEFGWELVIYDLERLRISLVGSLRHLVPKHPQIFCEPWFPKRGGLSIAQGRDTVVIDHAESDHAFATWLARKLLLDGYPTWCFGTAPMAGETADETVRLLIENRAVRYLPILSHAAIDDADLVSRCSLASNQDELVVPCVAGACDVERLGSRIKSLQPVRFENGWAAGLRELLTSLESRSIPKRTDAGRLQTIALRSFVPEPVTKSQPEPLITSVFPVTTMPETILVFVAGSPPDQPELDSARRVWAFVELASGLFAAFCPPPDTLNGWALKRKSEILRTYGSQIEGKYIADVVKELLRRSLELACHNAGLAWCEDRRLFYFPAKDSPQRRVSYTNIDGQRTNVSVTGIRQVGSGDQARQFHYQLAPIFRIGSDTEGRWWVNTRIYARVTEPDGTPLTGKMIGKRRRQLAKSWWNQHWLARTLGVMQAIANESHEIVAGPVGRMVIVSADPMTWDCPISIDESVVERLGDFQEEMAALRFIEDEGDDEDLDSEGVDD